MRIHASWKNMQSTWSMYCVSAGLRSSFSSSQNLFSVHEIFHWYLNFWNSRGFSFHVLSVEDGINEAIRRVPRVARRIPAWQQCTLLTLMPKVPPCAVSSPSGVSRSEQLDLVTIRIWKQGQRFFKFSFVRVHHFNLFHRRRESNADQFDRIWLKKRQRLCVIVRVSSNPLNLHS